MVSITQDQDGPKLRFVGSPDRDAADQPEAQHWVRWVTGPAALVRRMFRVGAVLCLTGLCVAVMTGVIARYVLDSPLYWTDDLATACLVWLTFLIVGPALHDNQLPSIHISISWLPQRGQTAWLLARDLITMVIGVLLALSGWDFARQVMHTPEINLPISEGVIYASFAIGGLGTVIELVARLATKCRAWYEFVGWLAVVAVVSFESTQLLPVTDNAALVVTVTLFVLLFLGLPLWLALTGSVLVGVLLGTTLPTSVIADHAAVGVIKEVLLAIPLYMLAGVLLHVTGLARSLVDFAESLVGWVRGGLGLTDILASSIFADMSCSANADAAAVGRVMIPQMIERGYAPATAAAIQSSAASLGILIPPATSLILYSSVTLVSVGTLFEAAVIPAIGVACTLAFVAYISGRRNGAPRGAAFSPKVAATTFVAALPALGTIAVILGGVLGGIVTAPESGVLAVTYTLLIATVMRAWPERPFRALYECLQEASIQTGRVASIIAGATAIGWILTLVDMPTKIVNFIARFCDTPIEGLIAINVIFLLFHLFMDAGPTILVVTPIILPLAVDLHINLVQLAITICVNSGIGMVLPPVGLLSYLTAGIAGVPVQKVFRAVLPYVAMLFADLALLIAFPVLTT